MLKEVSCNGFKSLDNFRLAFSPGLNVLVGPNGSGKTNVVVLLEFISRLGHVTLPEAVSSMGGAGKIFRRRSEGIIKPRIDIAFDGEAASPPYIRDEYRKIFYNYKASIIYLPEQNTIIYSSQQIRLIIDKGDSTTCESLIRVDCPAGENAKVHIDYLDLDMISYSRLRDNRRELEEQLEDACQAASAVFICDIVDNFINGAEVVTRDIAGARSFNIDPNKVRDAEDIAAPAYIQPNGEGFAATLNALQPRPLAAAMQRYMFFVPSFSSTYPNPETLLQEIVQYASLVNNDVVGIGVKSDQVEGRLSVYIDLKYDAGYISLPISLVSDGTAKWLALITAIITRPLIFAIEEPENFLHPSMQQEIIALVRRQFVRERAGEPERFALLTTHSETIINSIMPDELVIVSMEGGVTSVKRPTNSAEVNKQLEATGFGLSYYYMAGAIES